MVSVETALGFLSWTFPGSLVGRQVGWNRAECLPMCIVLDSLMELGWLDEGTVEQSGLRAESCRVLIRIRQC